MDIQAQAELQQMRDTVQRICAEYGLYGNIYYREASRIPYSDKNRLYIIAGTDPAIGKEPPPDRFCPDVIIRRREQNEKLFYPDVWAYDLTAHSDQMKAAEELVEFCRHSEFLSTIYSEHGLPLPEKIRESEMRQIMVHRDASQNFDLTVPVMQKSREALNWFFRREKSTGFRRRWLDFFRSDKFPDDKGPIAKLKAYFRYRRKDPRVSLEQMMEFNSDIKKLEMQEHEYKLWSDYLAKHYPEVTYVEGDKDVVNHGVDKPGDEPLKPFGRRITGEEFAVIRKERFAEEGWDCLADVKPSYWEFRDVYYKEADAALVAEAYHAVTLQYAKPDDLSTLMCNGPIEMMDISCSDLMNFVSLSKANGLRFYFDLHDEFDTPSLDKIHVIYNRSQRDILDGITDRMISDKVTYSHLIDEADRPALQDIILHAEQLKGPSKPREIGDRGPEI